MSLYIGGGLMSLLSGFLIFCSGLFFLGKEEVYMMEYFLYDWGGIDIKYEVMFDWVSCLYLSVVLLISGSVLIYSEGYMSSDINKVRFFLLMIMFVLSMIFLVISGGLISLLLGWDGLGLVSYCLVIYYNSSSSYKAGMITVMSNRIGDAFLLISIGWLLCNGDWNYWLLGFEKLEYSVYIMLSVILAASTKSAQVPFSAWLPEASAAPTPVSSLVHSSTLVTAGVFLLVRYNYLLGEVSLLLMNLSLMTMLVGGLGALVESDMKKVVAMSTLSQLGLSMFCLSVGIWKLAYLHMSLHAFFKALMFLCIGGVIHGMGGIQDFRFMFSKIYGGWVINQGLLISIMCLTGLPFLCGFYSKDLLLEIYLMKEKNFLGFFIFMFGFFMGIGYGIRLLISSMFGESMEMCYLNFNESWMMSCGIFLMSFFSLISGSLITWFVNFNFVICLDLWSKIMGLILFGFILFFMIFFKGMIYYMKVSFVQIKKYVYLMFFMSVFTGSSWMSLLLNFEEVEKNDQIWFEELGAYGIKSYFLKKFYHIYEIFENLNYFLKFLYYLLVVLLISWLMLN